MVTKYNKAIATEIINQFGAKPEMLVQVLHAFVQRYGFISEEAIRQIALELNLSRADVYGVVSYYHDFRTTSRPGVVQESPVVPNDASEKENTWNH